MEIKRNIELILIIFGLILIIFRSIFVGIILILIGTYYLNIKANDNNENKIDNKLKQKKEELLDINIELKKKHDEVILVDDEIDLQSVGLYEPKYDFLNSLLYKEKLDEIRKKQKNFIKNKNAAICEIEWEVDGDKRKGKAMTNSNIKQILRNFNLECEIIINKVKYSNRENSIKRIEKAFDSLNKLNERNRIKITSPFLDLKLQELDVAYEYELKKQEEKEILMEEREREKEERKIQRKLDNEKKKIEKNNESLETEINTFEDDLTNVELDEEKERLELKIKELNEVLAKNNEEIMKINNKRKRTGAGYVYIISNIGSFGEDIYKIGVTRRDDPQDRINELSNASVPFKYDTHAFIFSRDAFKLEKELHDMFNEKRVNKVNKRKEFFNINLEDVKRIVEKNKASVHSFKDKPEAKEYHETLKIKN